MISNKQCIKCKEIKSTNQYFKNNGFNDGYMSRCKQCARQYYKINKDKININAKEYYKNNPNQFRNTQLKSRYNITLEQYNALLIKQKSCCAICGKHELELNKALHVDHDHKCCHSIKSCGKCIRALLCQQCNLMIGNSNDNSEVLRKGADYVENKEKIN